MCVSVNISFAGFNPAYKDAQRELMKWKNVVPRQRKESTMHLMIHNWRIQFWFLFNVENVCSPEFLHQGLFNLYSVMYRYILMISVDCGSKLLRKSAKRYILETLAKKW